MKTEKLRQQIWKKLPELWNKKFELLILYQNLEIKIQGCKDNDLKKIYIIKAFEIYQYIQTLERIINLISWHL